MAYDRQNAVTVSVPCRYKDGSFSIWGGSPDEVRGLLLLDLGDAKLSVGPSASAVHLRNMMVEAKRKRCGRIRVVLDMPAHLVRIGEISGT